MGRQPLALQTLSTGTSGKSPAAHQFASDFREKTDIAKAFLEKSAHKMMKWADTKRRPVEFKEGDLVMVKLQPQQFKVFLKVHKGLIRKYEGPFPVLKKVGKVAYKLELPVKLKIHPV